jgi:hypothetical protein
MSAVLSLLLDSHDSLDQPQRCIVICMCTQLVCLFSATPDSPQSRLSRSGDLQLRVFWLGCLLPVSSSSRQSLPLPTSFRPTLLNLARRLPSSFNSQAGLSPLILPTLLRRPAVNRDYHFRLSILTITVRSHSHSCYHSTQPNTCSPLRLKSSNPNNDRHHVRRKFQLLFILALAILRRQRTLTNDTRALTISLALFSHVCLSSTTRLLSHRPSSRPRPPANSSRRQNQISAL